MTDSSYQGSSHRGSSHLGSSRDNTSRSDSTTSDDLDALLPRLQVIEDQPLAQRAAAFLQVHEQLRAALEGVDASA